jgi:protein SCO1
MTKRSSFLLVALAALAAAVLGFWLAGRIDTSGPKLVGGTWLARPRAVDPFTLTDQLGQPFTMAALQGKPSLVFFGFTHCPDVCPTTLATLAQVRKTAAVNGLQVIFVSLDPLRDTPKAVGAYVRAFDPAFVGVTGAPQAIDKMAANFGVATARVELPGGDYTIDHSAALFLLDTHGRIACIFTPPFDSRQLARDLQSAAPHLVTSS